MDGAELIECNKPVISSRRWNGTLLCDFSMLTELNSEVHVRTSGELGIDSIR